MDALEVIDQPTEELEIDPPSDELQGDDPPEPAEKQNAEPADKVDGRKFNPEWSKALKELRELYPDKADMLTKMRDNYARFQDVQALAPKGLDDIRAWKTTIDAVGGPEKAAEMMQRVAAQESMDARIESGDDGFIDELPETLQKGVYGMVPQLLSRLAEKDQAAFSAAVSPHFASRLAATGLGEHFKEMFNNAGDNETLKNQIRQAYKWFTDNTQGGAEGMTGATKTVSPEVARLRAQVAANEKGEQQKFVQGAVSTRDKAIDDSFKEHVAVYVKQFNLTETQQADLMDSFASKVKAGQGEGSAFLKQLQAYSSLKTRDQAQIDNFIKSATAQDAKQIIDALVTARYGGQKQRRAAAANTTTTTTQGGAIRVAQEPSQDQWDMDKMLALGHPETVMKGIFHLKGGKTVHFPRPK